MSGEVRGSVSDRVIENAESERAQIAEREANPITEGPFPRIWGPIPKDTSGGRIVCESGGGRRGRCRRAATNRVLTGPRSWDRRGYCDEHAAHAVAEVKP